MKDVKYKSAFINTEEVVDYTIRTKRGNFEQVVWIGQSEDDMLNVFKELRQSYDKIEKEDKELGYKGNPFEMSVEKRTRLFIEVEWGEVYVGKIIYKI